MRAGELLRRLDNLPLAGGDARLSRHPPRNRPVRNRRVAASVLLSIAAVLVTAVWASDGPGGGGDRTVGEVVRVGVAQGGSIPDYLRSSREELASLMRDASAGRAQNETYALVTLAAYVTPARLAPMLQRVAVSEVLGRVPLPDTQTEIVRLPALRLPTDAVAGMAQVAADKDREARDYRFRSAGLTGAGEQENELRRFYDTGAQVAQAEARAFRAQCACLYAAVVRGTPRALDEVRTRSGVRTVDPAPEVHRLDRTVFLPPLPEQADVARPPADRGLSAGTGAGPSPSPRSREPALPPPAPVAGTSSATVSRATPPAVR
ncbi:MAG TPA: hypothetical protein VF462_14830 [Micromonosporaceae bacterium]